MKPQSWRHVSKYLYVLHVRKFYETIIIITSYHPRLRPNIQDDINKHEAY